MNGLLAQAQQPQSRQATPEEQQAYKTMVTQVMSFLMQDDVVDTIEQVAKTKGPAQALAYVVSEALKHVGGAAMNAGVDVADHTGQAALGEVLTVIANVMQKSGMVEDVDATVQEALDIITTGGQKDSPQEEMTEPVDNPQEEALEV